MRLSKAPRKPIDDAAAFGGVRFGVGKMIEIVRQSGLAVHCDGVVRLRRSRAEERADEGRGDGDLGQDLRHRCGFDPSIIVWRGFLAALRAHSLGI